MKKKTSRSGQVFPDPMPALVRARKFAEEIARKSGTAILIAKDGRIVRILPRQRKTAVTRPPSK